MSCDKVAPPSSKPRAIGEMPMPWPPLNTQSAKYHWWFSSSSPPPSMSGHSPPNNYSIPCQLPTTGDDDLDTDRAAGKRRDSRDGLKRSVRFNDLHAQL